MIPCDSSNIWIKVLPILLIAGIARLGVHAQVPFSDQLTDQDLQKIISILGQAETRAEGSSPVPASLPSPPHLKSDRSAQASDGGKTGSRAMPPSQEDIAQSLSLLSTLLSSNPEAAAAMGMNLKQFAAPATTTTTENPNGLDAQNAALLNALLASSSSASAADTSKVAALLGLASATPTKIRPAPAPTTTAPPVKSNTQDAQSAAMLAQLLASVQGAQGVSPTGTVKQQDFGSFQNAPATLDASSSNQLSGILGLLGTLGSLTGGGGSGAQPSLFNLGGQQQQQQSNLLSNLLGGGGGQQQSQSNLLSSLLGGAGGGGQQQQNNLLATLLASQTQGKQQQSPGILSSLGTIASVLGSTLVGNRQKEGKPTVRGVDTRLGLGYRFGENADAQVVWEIGPQLFTEPLTSEQKKQQLLQQQLQQQYAQSQQNPNRRLHTVSKQKPPPTRASAPSRLAPSPTSLKIPSSTMMSRRLPPVPVSRLNAPSSMSLNAKPTYQPIPASTTLRQLRQQLLQQQVQPTPLTSSHQIKRNYYDKEEANPLANSNSQLTQYERMLLQEQEQQQTSHGSALQSNAAIAAYENRRDGFVFSKDSGNNVARVNALPPRRLVPAAQTVTRMGPGAGSHYNGASAGNFQRRSHYVNPAAEDSYAKRNAVGKSPYMSEYEREREREQSVLQSTRIFSSSDFSGHGHGPGNNRRTVMDTISKWNEKNSMVDVVQNFVLTSLKAPGNNWVKNFFMSKENEQKLSPLTPSAPPSSPSSTAQSPIQTTATSLQQQVQQQQQQHQQKSPDPTVTTEGHSGNRGILPSITGFLFPDRNKNPVARKPKPKPLVRVGDHVSYDELQMIIHGGKENVKREREKVIPTLRDASEITGESDGFSTPSPEIFIDISNGEVSMRKVFGTMDTFDPLPPEEIPPDSPKHVFNILREQLAKEYERVKAEQLKEAAKQRRKENIANGLINPNDPIYMVSKDFDLIEKES